MTGVLAGFDTAEALCEALRLLREDGIGGIETHTPAPLESEPAFSPLPALMLLAGLLGTCGGFAMQLAAGGLFYPEDIGGRPAFSWPSYLPIAFEIGVLSAMAAGFLGYMIANRLPRLYDPIDEAEAFAGASRDSWLVSVRAVDPATLRRARRLLRDLRPAALEDIA